MEITIKSDNEETMVTINDDDVPKLIDAIYWFLRDNHIKPIIETKRL